MRRLRSELGPTTHVIATGGLAGLLVPFIRETIDEVDDLLTLTGLRLIYERNRNPAPPAGSAPRVSAPPSPPGSGT